MIYQAITCRVLIEDAAHAVVTDWVESAQFDPLVAQLLKYGAFQDVVKRYAAQLLPLFSSP